MRAAWDAWCFLLVAGALMGLAVFTAGLFIVSGDLSFEGARRQLGAAVHALGDPEVIGG